MKFVDTPSKAKERDAMRKKIQEIQEKEAKQAKLGAEIRIKNRSTGQLSLGETTLSHFGKKR